MKMKLPWLVGISLLLVMGVAYFLYIDGISDQGRLYSSKSSLCREFAQSYLRTIPKTEKEFDENKRKMAVDVETELYNMCLLDLNPNTLGSFKLHAFEKYNK